MIRLTAAWLRFCTRPLSCRIGNPERIRSNRAAGAFDILYSTRRRSQILNSSLRSWQQAFLTHINICAHKHLNFSFLTKECTHMCCLRKMINNGVEKWGLVLQWKNSTCMCTLTNWLKLRNSYNIINTVQKSLGYSCLDIRCFNDVLTDYKGELVCGGRVTWHMSEEVCVLHSPFWTVKSKKISTYGTLGVTSLS